MNSLRSYKLWITVILLLLVTVSSIFMLWGQDIRKAVESITQDQVIDPETLATIKKGLDDTERQDILTADHVWGSPKLNVVIYFNEGELPKQTSYQRIYALFDGLEPFNLTHVPFEQALVMTPQAIKQRLGDDMFKVSLFLEFSGIPTSWTKEPMKYYENELGQPYLFRLQLESVPQDIRMKLTDLSVHFEEDLLTLSHL